MVWLREPKNRHVRQPKDESETVVHAIATEPAIPLKRKGEVVEQLRSLLQSGDFPPGSKLPPERALAVKLGVGRPALREAIKALSILDLLESRRGAGTFVKAQTGLSAWPSRPDLDGTNFELLDLLEVRKMFNRAQLGWPLRARHKRTCAKSKVRAATSKRRAMIGNGSSISTWNFTPRSSGPRATPS